MDERVSYWLDLCAYDLDTAKAMMETKRYLYVGFMCHQVVEKSLKGYHYHLLKSDAPYTHSLKRLALLTRLNTELSESWIKLISDLENMNIEARYPERKDDLARHLTKEICNRFILETEEFLRWINSKLLA
ncbi:MAG: HEPN domain-containing protein [Oscillospiraceae bacterium]|nr:HEPN domain-containing protein [Oscillospiraceae bacterium]